MNIETKDRASTVCMLAVLPGDTFAELMRIIEPDKYLPDEFLAGLHEEIKAEAALSIN